MKPIMKPIVKLITTALLTSYGCASTSQNQQLDRLATGGIEPPSPGQPKEEMVVLDPVSDWKKMFIAPPDSKTKRIISSNLEQWPKPKEAKDFLKKARLENALGRKSYAESTLRSGIRNFPTDPDIKLELALNLSEVGQHENAFALLSEIRQDLDLTTYPDKIFVFKYRYCLGISYLERGDVMRGQEIMSQLIGIDPTFSPAYVALGISYIKLGKLEAAEFVAKRALERAGQNPATMNLAGTIARRNGHLKESIEWFSKSLINDQNHIPSLVNRASVHLESNDVDNALKDIEVAMKIDPDHIDALTVYSSIIIMKDNDESAISILTKIIEIDQNNADARFNLALITERQKGAETDLRRLYQEVVQLSPESSSTHIRAKQRLSELKRWRPNL